MPPNLDLDMNNFNGSYSCKATSIGEWLSLKGKPLLEGPNFHRTMSMGGRVAYSSIFSELVGGFYPFEKY